MSTRQASRPSVFAIGHAHIDPVWVWDWKEGMREVVATFTAACDRLDACTDVVFTASSAAFYAWVEEVDPVLFDRVRHHVAAGRWLVVGGEWVEPDCNLPSGEAVCRQLLYSQRYFQKTFGAIARIGYNIDSFGHAGSLPQLFRKGGLDAYVMMRPQQHEKDLPSALFAWRGIDGTELATYRIPFGYNTGSQPGQGEAEVVRERVTTLMQRAGQERYPFMLFYGIGDHGGGPTREAIDELRRLRADSSDAVIFSGPAEYFEAAIEGRSGPLPVVEGDLHMHAVGCYSAVAWTKSFNARAERALVDAERLAALAHIGTGRALGVNQKLADAWKPVLFNQFHDSLGGTCTADAFDNLREFYGYALCIADEITAKATQAISARVDTWVPEAAAADRPRSLRPYVEHFPVPLVVFNPLSWPVTVPVVMPHEGGALTDDGGGAVAIQRLPSGEGTRDSSHPLAKVELPASGYRLFWLSEEAEAGDYGGGRHPTASFPTASSATDEPPQEGNTISASATGLTNGLLEVSIDKVSGAITGLRDEEGREWLSGEGIRPVVLEDPSDTWSHGLTRYEGEEQPCSFIGATAVESGPVRAMVRLAYRWHGSEIYEDVYLYAGERALGVRLLINWSQQAALLKLIVPVAGAEPRATVGVPYGAISRPADGLEEVMQRWVDVATPDGGLGCISDVTYAYDLADGRLRLTLLRSPRFADHAATWKHDRGIEPSYTDQGTHRVSLLIVPHRGSWAEAGVARRAEEHCTTFPIVSETWHTGPLPGSEQFVDVEPENVSVSVIKRAEDGSGLVLRVVELSGRRAPARVAIGRLGRAWQGSLVPYEVKTLLFPDDPAQNVVEVDIAELAPID